MANRFGEYNPDGSLKQEADECILTGQHVDPDNSVREKVAYTPFFYRVIQHQYDRVTNAQRGQWRAKAREMLSERQQTEAPAVASGVDAPPGSSEPAMSEAPASKKKGGA